MPWYLWHYIYAKIKTYIRLRIYNFYEKVDLKGNKNNLLSFYMVEIVYHLFNF